MISQYVSGVLEMNRASFFEEVKEFLASKIASDVKRTEITIDTDLFDAGHVTSLSYLSLILHLEKRLGIDISLSRFDSDSFRTVGRLYKAIEQSLGKCL